MLAVAMNGQPLPVQHGFPVRMVVPGLYGYVSATKWLAELELSSFADFDAYWAMRAGELLYLEELNRVPEETLNVLITVLTEGEITVPRLGLVRATAGFRLIAPERDRDALLDHPPRNRVDCR